jgi:hypothetical protein
MIVGDIEENLDAGIMQRSNCDLEAGDAVLAEIAQLGRKESKSRIPPIVPESFFTQEAVVAESMDRHQFNRRDAELDEMLEDCRMAQSSIGAAHGERDALMEIG